MSLNSWSGLTDIFIILCELADKNLFFKPYHYCSSLYSAAQMSKSILSFGAIYHCSLQSHHFSSSGMVLDGINPGEKPTVSHCQAQVRTAYYSVHCPCSISKSENIYKLQKSWSFVCEKRPTVWKSTKKNTSSKNLHLSHLICTVRCNRYNGRGGDGGDVVVMTRKDLDCNVLDTLKGSRTIRSQNGADSSTVKLIGERGTDKV